MKILELTNYSKGICGVWTRVYNESFLLSKRGHEVIIFSSNRIKGSNFIAEDNEIINNIKIKRFPSIKLGGESFMKWDFKKEALKLKPNIIIAHSYRHLHILQALKIAKKLNIPCLLVTHAPFLEKKLRGWKENLAVFLYDKFIGKKIINKYSKVIAITKWEIPYLIKLGCDKKNIIVVPNGIPDEFFKSNLPKKYQKNKILFLGRIAPIKNLEVLICAISLLQSSKIFLDLVGPAEENYKIQLQKLIKKLNLKKQVRFFPVVYNIKEKIKLIDSYEIFVLPSKREAMPQALIEVMARKKIVVSSDTDGGKEIITNKINGFLFENDNKSQLSNVLERIFLKKEKEKLKIKDNAGKFVEQFSWGKLINKLENIILSKNL